MMWIPHPANVVQQRCTGLNNMGDVTDRENTTARFGLRGEGRWVLLWFKVRFVDAYSGAGSTGNATMTLKLDHHDESEAFDWTEFVAWGSCGSDGTITDLEVRIPADEYPRFSYEDGDELVFEWTNPDGEKMRWAVEVGLARAA